MKDKYNRDIILVTENGWTTYFVEDSVDGASFSFACLEARPLAEVMNTIESMAPSYWVPS